MRGFVSLIEINTMSTKSIWFKNLIFYRFTKPFELTTEKLELALRKFAFLPCNSSEISRYGWVEPFGEKAVNLVHESSGCVLIKARKEEKVLPSEVIKEMVEEKVREIQEAEQRKVGAKERQQIKDEVILMLLPRAFSRFTDTSAYIDKNEGLLIIDAPTFNKAEELMCHLRKTLGTLPVLPVVVKESTDQSMTSWVEHDTCPAPFKLGEEAELVEPGENGAIARFKRQDLYTDEVVNHIELGKLVTKLALSFDKRVDFIMNDDLTVKRLKFSESVIEDNEEIEDPLARMDADFTLMCSEVQALIPALISAFGGELLPDNQ